MKIRIISDLHMNHYRHANREFPFTHEGEDVLLLVGDIDIGVDDVVDTLKSFIAAGVPEVVYVTGNHEYCDLDFDEVNKGLREALKESPHIHFLLRDTVVIGGVSFIGSTLWTNFHNEDHWSMLNAAHNIEDFSVIRRGSAKFSPTEAVAEYVKTASYIKMMYEQIKGKKVILTHFLPAKMCIAPKFRGANALNDYFSNDLDEWIYTLENTTWVFGHTHESRDFMLGETRMICNPQGYFWHRNPHFKQDFIIEL